MYVVYYTRDLGRGRPEGIIVSLPDSWDTDSHVGRSFKGPSDCVWMVPSASFNPQG
jgi:hypothetical protein